MFLFKISKKHSLQLPMERGRKKPTHTTFNALPLKIKASVSIKVSGVRFDRGANIVDSGKQLWAFTHSRTAFL